MTRPSVVGMGRQACPSLRIMWMNVDIKLWINVDTTRWWIAADITLWRNVAITLRRNTTYKIKSDPSLLDTAKLHAV
jgi:hypothetical protein